MKSSGAGRWLVWTGAVLVTTAVGLLSLTVFVLAKVFGSPAPGDPAQADGQVPATARSAPRVSPSPAMPVMTSRPAPVLEIHASTTNPRLAVLIISTPSTCTRSLRAAAYAEGPGAVAVNVVQQTVGTNCPEVRRSVLVAARAPLADRTLIVNHVSWNADATGRYTRAGAPTPTPASAPSSASLPTAPF